MNKQTINKGSPIVSVNRPRNLSSCEHGQRTTEAGTWRTLQNSKPVTRTRKQAA